MLTKIIKIDDLIPMKDAVGGKGGKKPKKLFDLDNINSRGDGRLIVPPYYTP